MNFTQWTTLGAHSILKQWCNAADRKFVKQSHALEKTQRQILEVILKHTRLAQENKVQHYEQFVECFAATRYADWREEVESYRQHNTALSSSKLIRFQPTSGSSEQIKFIPYTQLFLDELDHAIAPWLASMYRKCPDLALGTHYWSVSWLPESQREILSQQPTSTQRFKAPRLMFQALQSKLKRKENVQAKPTDNNLNDDSALLGLGKRLLSKFTQAVPSHVAFAADADDALFATLCYLVSNRNLSMISVWSPTFALQLLERLETMQHEVYSVLKSGCWGARQNNLHAVKAPHDPQSAQCLMQSAQDNGQIDFKQLWPKLSLISSWDTSNAKRWAEKLQQRLPDVQFEGKGLWATEGVVTIPYNNQYPLAYQSHFYEFEYLEGDQKGCIIPSWQLRLGDVVSPLISSGNGILRYCLDDCLVVTGFLGQVPCFEFQGRRFGVDLVGEKIAPETAQQLLADLNEKESKAVCLLAVDTELQSTPFYCVLFEGDIHCSIDDDYIDRVLRQNFHYELARNLGQLDQPQIRQAKDGWDAYKKILMLDGMIEGNIKPEAIKKISLASLEQL